MMIAKRAPKAKFSRLVRSSFFSSLSLHNAVASLMPEKDDKKIPRENKIPYHDK
ncbi:Uncharacterised protein [Chlamydia trachomatis]|nr:Uncharacterised protein [Chlamydia trachomatis]CRH48563.1 Uncharacterised protein [Chlamydia trachomatis]